MTGPSDALARGVKKAGLIGLGGLAALATPVAARLRLAATSD